MTRFDYPFTDQNSVLVSQETCTYAKYTFPDHGQIWEYNSIKQMKLLIQKYGLETGTFVDVGAQVGLYTLCAKFYPEMTFYAFEPLQKSCDILRENLRLNDIKNVQVFELALSDKKGKATLNTSRDHSGLHTLGSRPVRFSDIVPVEVETTTLDLVFADKWIDYLKIDTEGWEYFVIRGGVETINRCKPILQLEVNPANMSQCGVDKDEFISLLERTLSYSLFHVQDSEEYYFVP